MRNLGAEERADSVEIENDLPEPELVRLMGDDEEVLVGYHVALFFTL